MTYKSLYNDRQAEGEYLPRSWYIEQTERLQWVRNISIKKNPHLKSSKGQGFIVRKNAEQHGGITRFDYFIRIAGDLSIEAERFVVIKELMHCHFGPTPENLKYATGNAIVFNTHFRQMFGDSAIATDSPHVQAELMALWMACGVLMPEHLRNEYVARVHSGDDCREELARKLCIPLKQAYNLTSSQYEDEIAAILN